MDRKRPQLRCITMLRAGFPSQGLPKAGAAISVLSIAFLLGACSPAADAPATSAVAPPRAADAAKPSPAQIAARMQECRSTLEAGIPSGLVINAAADNGRPILWVGPAWQGSPKKDKESLARDTACFFLSGDESKTLKFSIYDQSTDREVAVWDRTHLIEW